MSDKDPSRVRTYAPGIALVVIVAALAAVVVCVKLVGDRMSHRSDLLRTYNGLWVSQTTDEWLRFRSNGILGTYRKHWFISLSSRNPIIAVDEGGGPRLFANLRVRNIDQESRTVFLSASNPQGNGGEVTIMLRRITKGDGYTLRLSLEGVSNDIDLGFVRDILAEDIAALTGSAVAGESRDPTLAFSWLKRPFNWINDGTSLLRRAVLRWMNALRDKATWHTDDAVESDALVEGSHNATGSIIESEESGSTRNVSNRQIIPFQFTGKWAFVGQCDVDGDGNATVSSHQVNRWEWLCKLRESQVLADRRFVGEFECLGEEGWEDIVTIELNLVDENQLRIDDGDPLTKC